MKAFGTLDFMILDELFDMNTLGTDVAQFIARFLEVLRMNRAVMYHKREENPQPLYICARRSLC